MVPRAPRLTPHSIPWLRRLELRWSEARSSPPHSACVTLPFPSWGRVICSRSASRGASRIPPACLRSRSRRAGRQACSAPGASEAPRTARTESSRCVPAAAAARSRGFQLPSQAVLFRVGESCPGLSLGLCFPLPVLRIRKVSAFLVKSRAGNVLQAPSDLGRLVKMNLRLSCSEDFHPACQ